MKLSESTSTYSAQIDFRLIKYFVYDRCKKSESSSIVDTHCLFVDFKAVYCSVNSPNLWKIMEEFHILKKLLDLVGITLDIVVKLRVRIRDELSDHFDGLR